MSPVIQPDLSQVSDMGPIEPGVYDASIETVDAKTSSAGNPMIVVGFNVVVDGKPRKRNAYLVITGAGAYGFEQLLRACGFDMIADAYRDKDAEKPPFDTDELIGQQLQVQVESADYQGQLRDQIKSYLKA